MHHAASAAERVRALVARVGVLTTAALLGSSRETITRVCAGLDVRRGSRVQIETSLAVAEDIAADAAVTAPRPDARTVRTSAAEIRARRTARRAA
jgi:hypothetical protein